MGYSPWGRKETQLSDFTFLKLGGGWEEAFSYSRLLLRSRSSLQILSQILQKPFTDYINVSNKNQEMVK